MSEGRFAMIRRIVLTVTDLPREDRSAYLDEVCGDDTALREEVESLLAHAGDGPAILDSDGLAQVLGQARLLGERDGLEQERIGPYRILEVLGKGGMGVVYRAEQIEPIHREVALKLVARGMDSAQIVARFESERQVLALMDHPGIARVLDAGTDEQGRPYFVMELVDGVPITRHCEERAVPVRERLRLVQQICAAVQHAHQKGIIHRDLKPSNLLVASQDGVPTPKVIDFGIAKALEESALDDADLTREGQRIGSLRYMSPEQARGETGRIDTRSDVYALGVLLYVLLTGEHPCPTDSGASFDLIKAICEQLPRPFPPVLAGGDKRDADLETIVMKALAKDPDARYQSVAALGDDLERFLTSQPILARPPSAAYQLRKLVARNRIPAALVGGIAVLVLGFGLGMSILYARADANLRRALTAEGEAATTSDFLEGLFKVSEPAQARGDSLTARQLLDDGAARVATELANQPAVQVRVLRTIGAAYGRLGLYDRATSLLETALARQESLSAVGQPVPVESHVLDDLATVYNLAGEYEQAQRAHQRSLALKTEMHGARDTTVAVTLTNLALVYREEARLAEAESLLAVAREIFGEVVPGTLQHAHALNNLAQVYQDQGRFDEAVALFDESLTIREAVLPPNHPALATALNNLAGMLREKGRSREAAEYLARAIAIWEHVLGPEHPSFGVALVNLAALYKDAGQYAEAEVALLRGLAVLETSLGPDHVSVATALNNLGRLYQQMERFDAAQQALERSLAIQRSVFGEDHPGVATSLNSLGELALARGDLEGADPCFRRAIEIREAAYGPDHFWTALPVHNLGVLRLEQGRLEEAEPLLRRALAVREAAVGPVHVRIAESLEACAEMCRRQGRAAAADSLGRRAAAVRAKL